MSTINSLIISHIKPIQKYANLHASECLFPFTNTDQLYAIVRVFFGSSLS